MKQLTFMEKYPIFTFEITKNESIYVSIDEIMNYFSNLVKNDTTAKYIGEFNHYEHTSALVDGEISHDIIDARLIVFCFGQKLTNPNILAVRPRSIGVCEKEGSFVISFLEAPMPAINTKVEGWIKGLAK